MKLKKVAILGLILVVLFSLVYWLGPRFPQPILDDNLPQFKFTVEQTDSVVNAEMKAWPVKPDNEGRIFWVNDSAKKQTEYCLLYLHGFSASWFEGEPVHRHFAQRYGMNLYTPLLLPHGLITNDPLLDMTPDKLYQSAKQALVMAHILGKKVLIMSTSTGGTLSLKLAHDFPELVDGLFLFSPNIAINDKGARVLNNPWGLKIARWITGDKYRITNTDSLSTDCKYWNCKYRLEAAVYLEQLVESTMKKETFEKVKCPVLLQYYFKDEQNQDPVVKVSAMHPMFDQLGTPENLKKKQAVDAETHTIASQLFSKSWQEVEENCYHFAEEILKLKSPNTTPQ